MAIPPLSTDPIFILGISQRSGTNFLFDLVCLHPDCGAPSKKWEDFLLHKSDLLVQFVDSVYRGWHRWGAEKHLEDSLYEHLGDALISVLASRIEERRLVTKTPSVRNLPYFFKLFPRAYLVILIRNGRAVVESRVKTFGESYETAMRRWADGADSILRFRQSADARHQRYLIVRYEDLWNETRQELRRIFAFLSLDSDQYDFEAAINMPVRGSSTFYGKEEKEYHWKPVEKTADFNPVSRADHWSRSIHERFNWIVGQKQVSLGYEQQKFDGNEFLWIVWNEMMDLRWQFLQWSRFTVRSIKNVLKLIFGAERMSKIRRTVLGFARPLSN